MGSALIHGALVLGLGRIHSAQDRFSRTEIVQFELFGNSDVVTSAVQTSRRQKSRGNHVVRKVTVSAADLPQTHSDEREHEIVGEGLEAKEDSGSDLGSSGVFGREDGIEVSAQERYRRELQAMLERRKDYPLLAKRLRQEGKVLVRFTLQRDGHVLAAEVIENSPFESLNQAAQKLISEINGLKPFPDEIKRNQWVFILPVEYRM